jgi:hypothetical protein
VYAPALVAWVGGPQFSVSVSIGGPVLPAVGWVPLAPREVFVPYYRYSPRYVERVNPYPPHPPGRPRPPVQVPTGPVMYGNQGVPGAVTVVPRDVLVQRQPVGRAVIDVREAGRPTVALPPPRPVAPAAPVPEPGGAVPALRPRPGAPAAEWLRPVRPVPAEPALQSPQPAGQAEPPRTRIRPTPQHPEPTQPRSPSSQPPQSQPVPQPLPAVQAPARPQPQAQQPAQPQGPTPQPPRPWPADRDGGRETPQNRPAEAQRESARSPAPPAVVDLRQRNPPPAPVAPQAARPAPPAPAVPPPRVTAPPPPAAAPAAPAAEPRPAERDAAEGRKRPPEQRAGPREADR